MAKVLLGKVVGAKGEKGDSYSITTSDYEEIVDKVKDTYLPNAKLTINVIDDLSTEDNPVFIWATVKIYVGTTLVDTLTAENKKLELLVAPYQTYKIEVIPTSEFTTPTVEEVVVSPRGLTKTIKCVHSSEVYFTVDYVSDGITVDHQAVLAHGSTTYQGEEINPTGKIWTGWDKTADDVVSNMTINAVFCVPQAPAEIKDLSQYTYVYSDFSDDSMAYTQAEFAYIMLNDLAKTYLTVGCLIKMKVSSTVITDTSIVFMLEGFNHFRRVDNNEFALTVWGMLGLLNSNLQINNTNTNVGGYPAMQIRSKLENIFKSFDAFWVGMAKKVVVLSSKGGQTPDIVSSEDRFFLRSQCEVGFDTSAVPYKNEVDSEAETKSFAYYNSNNRRIKKYFNGEGSATYWWIRSPYASSSTTFANVNTNGTADSSNATGSYGVSACFCI